MWVYWVALATGPVILAVACLVYRLNGLRSFWGRFLWGWAFQIVLSLPAGIWQAATGWGYLTTSFTRQLLIPWMGWPFNAAGFSVRAFALGPYSHGLNLPRDIPGWILDWPSNVINFSVGISILGRDSHWLKEPAVYFFAMICQASVVAAVFAWRYTNHRSLRDPVIIALAVFSLANSLINVGWEWLPPG